jgi:hypothetical protein
MKTGKYTVLQVPIPGLGFYYCSGAPFRWKRVTTVNEHVTSA